MNIKYLCLFVAFIFSFSPKGFSQCDVNVSSNDELITITGLTSTANSKLFDANIQSVWGCDPWNGAPCTTEEVVSGLTVGETYFLSVQSSNCDEWIAVEVQGGDVQPTCVDGIQNQGETAIDCGGPCEPCVINECNVVTTSENGVIHVSGLTSDTNTKLFDTAIAAVWECNPWNGNVCSGSETISGLTAGATYFLSVQSTVCAEWSPIVVSGGGGCPDADGDFICDDVDCAPDDPTFPNDPGVPCDDFNELTENDVIQNDGCSCAGTLIEAPMECNVMITTENGNALVTDLPADANAKLFDASFSVAWECNPWNGNPCSETATISNLNNGIHYLSVQSATCDFWMEVTIVNDNGGDENACAKILSENVPFDCVSFLENGSVRIDIGSPQTQISKFWFDEFGEFINTVDFFPGSTVEIEGNQIIKKNYLGNQIGVVNIDPAITNNFIVDGPVSAYENSRFAFVGKLFEGAPAPGETITDEVWLFIVDATGNKVAERFITSIEYTFEDYQAWGNNIYEIEGVIATSVGQSGANGIEVYIKRYASGIGLSELLSEIIRYDFSGNLDFVNQTVLKSATDGDHKFIDLHIVQDHCQDKSWNVECIELNLETGSETIVSENVIHNFFAPFRRRTTTSTSFEGDIEINSFLLEVDGIFEKLRISRTAVGEPLFPGEFTMTAIESNGDETNDGTIFLNELPIHAFKSFEDGAYRIITAHGNKLSWYISNCESLPHNEATQNVNTPNMNSSVDIQDLFPNPTNGETFLRLESTTDQNVLLQIYDVIGQLKFSRNIDLEIGINTFDIDVNHFTNGIYNMTITDQADKMETIRFVKN